MDLKKWGAVLLSTSAGCLLAGSALLFLNAAHDSVAVERNKSMVPYCVSAVEVPKSVEFAGQTFDLTRYDLRERMDRELMSYTYMHSTTLLSIKRANRFFPIIEPILKEQNIPDDLKYLMVVESSLETRAVSPAGAAGLWQIMGDTGRQYGLEVNGVIDERYHVEKATVAACKYLRQAYNKYGDWLTVAASYNGGQGRISSELNKQQGENALDLWLVQETSRYMFRLLACKMVFQNPMRYGFMIKAEDLYPPIEYKEVVVTTEIADLASWAKQQGTQYALLKDANPWLRDRNLANKSGKQYVLKIPTRESIHYDPKMTPVWCKDWITE